MKILLVVLAILCMATFAMAQETPQYLACDPQTGVTQYKLEITKGGVMQPTIVFVAQPDGSAKFDLTPYSNGVYSFRLAAADASGWWGAYSDPFAATKPGKVGGIKIITPTP